MREFFRDKYGEVILNKQKSLGEYKSAIKNLQAAFHNKLNQADEANLISNEFPKSIYNTLNELEKLQIKKLNIKTDHSIHSANNFSDFYDFMQSSNIASFEETKDALSQSTPTSSVITEVAQNHYSPSLEPVKQSTSSVTLDKEKTNSSIKKNKPSLKVTIKNDAPLPPPWIQR